MPIYGVAGKASALGAGSDIPKLAYSLSWHLSSFEVCQWDDRRGLRNTRLKAEPKRYRGKALVGGGSASEVGASLMKLRGVVLAQYRRLLGRAARCAGALFKSCSVPTQEPGI